MSAHILRTTEERNNKKDDCEGTNINCQVCASAFVLLSCPSHVEQITLVSLKKVPDEGKASYNKYILVSSYMKNSIFL